MRRERTQGFEIVERMRWIRWRPERRLRQSVEECHFVLHGLLQHRGPFRADSSRVLLPRFLDAGQAPLIAQGSDESQDQRASREPSRRSSAGPSHCQEGQKGRPKRRQRRRLRE